MLFVFTISCFMFIHIIACYYMYKNYVPVTVTLTYRTVCRYLHCHLYTVATNNNQFHYITAFKFNSLAYCILLLLLSIPFLLPPVSEMRALLNIAVRIGQQQWLCFQSNICYSMFMFHVIIVLHPYMLHFNLFYSVSHFLYFPAIHIHIGICIISLAIVPNLYSPFNIIMFKVVFLVILPTKNLLPCTINQRQAPELHHVTLLNKPKERKPSGLIVR